MALRNVRVSLFCALVVASATSAQADVVIYADDFSGAGATLNGAVPDTRPGTELWSANNAFNDNGTINGSNEGSALLPFAPATNMKYTLSMDVLMPVGVAQWVALGFAQDPLTAPGTNFTNDRFTGEVEGIAWMLYRDFAGGPANDIQVFGGRRTTSGIADNDASITFGVSHKLSILLDTSGTGASFTADFQIDGTSVVGGSKTISTLGLPGGVTPAPGNLLNQIRYVGFSFDNTAATPPSFDNFSLTAVAVPEASSLIAVGCAAGLGSVGLTIRRRMRRQSDGAEVDA